MAAPANTCWDVCVGVCVRGYAVCICAVGHPVSISTLTDMDSSTQLLSLIQTEPPEPDSGSQRSLSCHMVALFILLRSPFTLHFVKSPMQQHSVGHSSTLPGFPFCLLCKPVAAGTAQHLCGPTGIFGFDLVFPPIKYFRTRPISSVRVTH